MPEEWQKPKGVWQSEEVNPLYEGSEIVLERPATQGNRHLNIAAIALSHCAQYLLQMDRQFHSVCAGRECTLCGSLLMGDRSDAIWIRPPYGGVFREVHCRICSDAGRTCKYVVCPCLLRGLNDLVALFQTCTATSFGWQSPGTERRIRFVDPQWILDHDLILDAWRECKRRGGRLHRLPQYRPPLGANQ